MMKGISNDLRNNAWHLRHTKKKASDRAHRAVRLAFYKIGGNRLKQAESQFKKAQEREKLITFTFWQRVKLFFRKLFNKPIAYA